MASTYHNNNTWVDEVSASDTRNFTSSASLVGNVSTNNTWTDEGKWTPMNKTQRSVAQKIKEIIGFDSLNMAEEIQNPGFFDNADVELLAELYKEMQEKGLKNLHPNAHWKIDDLRTYLKEELPKSKYHKLL